MQELMYVTEKENPTVTVEIQHTFLSDLNMEIENYIYIDLNNTIKTTPI